ncbi:MAG: flagellar basal-body rod protein FlgF [Calditrichaeota bacterium]|nr:flagellar basal-body rod protein FlgF [Calditrichota bacterium]
MIKGLFINKAGMLPQQRRLEIAANNLANSNTIGFKKEKIYFRQLIQEVLDPGNDENRMPGVTETDFSEGVLKQTNNPLDVAIVGEGFFVIETDEGELYTRNGNFTLDADGRLITQNGYPVATDGGEMQLIGQSVQITEHGEIVMDGQIVGRLRIVTFDDPRLLQRVQSTYFAAGEATPIELTENEINLRTGYLETSNVNPLDELLEMIEVNRLYELGQKSIKAQDETLEKLINQAGRL